MISYRSTYLPWADDRIGCMEIRRLGDKTLQIRGKKECVLIDPSDVSELNDKSGCRLILLTSKMSGVAALAEGKVIVSGPGEYEVGGIEVTGLKTGEGSSLYLLSMEGVMIGVMGGLKEELSDKKVEKVASVDVLVLSLKEILAVGEKKVLSWAKGWGVNYLILVGYQDKKELLDKYLDETDSEGAEEAESLKVDKDSLPEGMEVVLLKYGRSN